jgi:HEAT repeat protein
MAKPEMRVGSGSPGQWRRRARCGVAVALFAVLVPRFAAGNDRAQFWTMGRSIEHSTIIALADAKTSTTPGYQSILELHEVLKGRAAPSERTIAIKWDCLESGPFIPPDSKGVAILLAEGWQRAECPLLEAYQKPPEIAALRSLLRIYTLPSERNRLEALRALVNDPNPLFRVQLFDDLKQMQEPANFQIVLDLFDAVDEAARRDVVQVLGVIGDIRGVPTLLKALTSPDPMLREPAEAILSAEFRGAPGVDEALRQARRRSPQSAQLPQPPETRFQAATELWESGRRERGRLLFLAVAGDRNESDYVRVRSALTIGSTLSQSERDTLQAAMRPLLVRFVAKTNYLESGALQEAAQILRALRSQKNLDLLMALFDPREHEFVHQETHYIAAQAIRELGPTARRRAAERLLARIEAVRKAENVKGNQGAGEPAATLLALAWLGDADQIEKIELWRWNQLHPLVGVGQQQDEGLFLVQVLQNHPNLALAQDWVLFRLGELEEKRAVAPLIHILATRYADPVRIPNALVQIAGPLVESEAAKLLTSPRPEAREAAMKILYELQGARMLPLLRRMMAEKDFGVKSRALDSIGSIGEPADLKVLIPIADFWTGDRANLDRARVAVAEIRRRHHYDLRGPIPPPAPRPPSPRPPA